MSPAPATEGGGPQWFGPISLERGPEGAVISLQMKLRDRGETLQWADTTNLAADAAVDRWQIASSERYTFTALVPPGVEHPQNVVVERRDRFRGTLEFAVL